MVVSLEGFDTKLEGYKEIEIHNCTLQVSVYSAESPLAWREVEGGELPSPMDGVRASVVNNILYVHGGDTCGYYLTDGCGGSTTVLSWDPAGQTWQEVGNLAVGRDFHAAVAVPESFIDCK